ncbi:MAG: FAD-binding oxidoreductase, partial [Candidatus Thermoplasmatota archaeon]|nr:FAD-binding oxidoreductase [Candidatus Thermoplasmatota archaeon]
MALNNELAVIIPFLADESNAFHAQLGKVRGVHYPESEADIVEIMKNAGDKITVSGAGTGLTGSRVPMHGGIVVSMEKMLRAEMRNDCREIVREGLAGKIRIYLDDEKNIAHVAPGVSLSELTAALPDNLIYPPDPTETLASLGGTVATNASGARCFHYGPTRNWIVGLRIILTDSEVLAIRRGECFADQNRMLDFNSESGKKYSIRIPDYHMPSVKNAAGLYSKPGMDLIDLFIGSEGILGITTEITIKLQPSEKEPVSDLAFFSTDENALNYVNALRPMKNRGILAIEYFDGNALNFIRDQHPDIPPNAAAAILVEMKGEALDILTELSDMLAANNALADWCATNSPDRRDMKEFRHSLPDSVNTYLKQHDSYKLGTDFAVPAEKFPEMMERYRNAGRKFRAKFP